MSRSTNRLIIRNTRQQARPATWLLGFALGMSLLGMVPVSNLVATAAADPADHLIISEFQAMTRNPVSSFGSPFIEVTNATAELMEMGDVYLTDATTIPAAAYYNIALTTPGANNPGGGNGGDFHAKFPAGFTLAAGQSVVISLNGSTEYFSAFGRQPDFELYEDGTTPDGVAEMVEAFPGSINAGPLGGSNVPALADVAESLVLYQWDGSSDNVVDLDYVMWGDNDSVRIDKTGLTIGGHTYLADTASELQEPVADSGPTFRHSFQRVSTDEGTETLTGGNGISDHDETSENLATTWADVDPADPAPALPMAFPSAPIVTELSNGRAVEGETIALTVAVVTFGIMDAVDFFYSVDGGSYSQVSGTDAGDGEWTADIPAQVQDAVVTYYVEMTNADGGSCAYPVAAPTFSVNSLTVEAPPEPGSEPVKLLITEVSTGENIYPFTSMAQLAMEFIEIHNPSDDPVDLSDYYLTDAINYNYSTQQYWYIAQGNPSQSTVGGGHYNDFLARFPDGYTIGARETITISMAGSSWFNAYFGIMPNLEMYEDDATADAIPDMRPVFENPVDDLPGNSIYTADRPYGGSSDEMPKGIPELEEHYGEPLILYHYIEGDDLVTDIDVFMWGEAKTGDFRYGFDKTGETQGSSSYEDDTPIASQDWYMPMDESGTVSYTRTDADEGLQTQDDGNGVDGRDETSEDWNGTFETLTFSPGIFFAGEGGDTGEPVVKLIVPARTFNPTMGEEFPITLVGKSDSEARLRVYDREGRLVVTLWDSRFDGDVSPIEALPTNLTWDGRSDTYELVKAGMYILHFSVVNIASGDEETQTVPVVVATRLSN